MTLFLTTEVYPREDLEVSSRIIIGTKAILEGYDLTRTRTRGSSAKRPRGFLADNPR